MPDRLFWVNVAGAAVIPMDHEAPFQASASGVGTWYREVWLPTAAQEDADRHATPDSPLNWSFAGLGAGWTGQEVPFHVSASVSTVELMPALVR